MGSIPYGQSPFSTASNTPSKPEKKSIVGTGNMSDVAFCAYEPSVPGQATTACDGNSFASETACRMALTTGASPLRSERRRAPAMPKTVEKSERAPRSNSGPTAFATRASVARSSAGVSTWASSIRSLKSRAISSSISSILFFIMSSVYCFAASTSAASFAAALPESIDSTASAMASL